MATLQEQKEFWHKLQDSPDWENYRLGGDALSGYTPEQMQKIQETLGLPWKDAGPTTVSRSTWFLHQLGRNGFQIARFIREMLVPHEGESTDETVTQLMRKMPLETTTEEELVGKGRLEYGDQQVVILDIGTQYTKAGWGAENVPQKIFPSVVDGVSPLNRGVVSDWPAYETLTRQAFEFLKTDPSKYPVLFCVAPKTPKQHKAKIAKMLFETFKAPSIFICTTTYAGLCSTNEMGGLVVNVGAGIIHTVPYYEGLCIQHAIRRLDIAGQDVVEFIAKACCERGDKVSNAEAEKFRPVLYVEHEKDFQLVSEEIGTRRIATGFRANGGEVPLGQEIFKGPEMMFRPSIMNRETAGLPEIIKETIMACDIDTRKVLWTNIIVCGGASLYPGFVERLKKEIAALAPDNMIPVVNVVEKRLTNTHLGANNLAFYEEFYDWCISPEEFEDEGEQIFETKCNN